MYKPNFCVECGERIARVRWHLWTSRRFCFACAPRFRRRRLAISVLASALIIAAITAGVRVALRASPPPLVLFRPADAPAASDAAARAGGSSSAPSVPPSSREPNSADTIIAPASAPVAGPDGTSTERPTDPGEIVSMCGARTKKGTPCTRRVRGTGRCWQHRGMPAMLPPEKLIIRG